MLRNALGVPIGDSFRWGRPDDGRGHVRFVDMDHPARSDPAQSGLPRALGRPLDPDSAGRRKSELLGAAGALNDCSSRTA